MSFKDQLDGELKKRGLSENTSDASLSIPPKIVKFSFKSFFIAVFLGTFLIGTLIGWAELSKEKTQAALVKKLPSKTAIIENANSEIYRMGESSTRLTMRDAVPEAVAVEPLDAKPPQDISDEEKAFLMSFYYEFGINKDFYRVQRENILKLGSFSSVERIAKEVIDSF